MAEIHLISRQVGTAYPFVEFSKLLTSKGFKVRNFLYASSFGPFQYAGTPFDIVTSFEDYVARVEAPPRVLMTGTSLEGADDAKYWNYAETGNFASIAWVDQPINLEERFSAGRPKVILANDRHTLAHLNKIGIIQNVMCFGSPYLDSLAKTIKRSNIAKGTIFFASEPYFENRSDFLIRPKSPNRIKFGFDDVDALLLATEFVSVHSRLTGEPWKILVRPHPCDNITRLTDAYRNADGDLKKLEFTDLEKEKILEQASVIFGMRSMFLFEAASLGIPTVSFQPGSRISWPFMDSHKGIMRLTGEHGDLEKLSDLLNNLKDHKTETHFDETQAVKLFYDLGNFKANEIRMHG